MTLPRPVHHALFDFRLGDTPCAEAFDGFLDEGRSLIAGQIVPFSSNVIREEVVLNAFSSRAAIAFPGTHQT